MKVLFVLIVCTVFVNVKSFPDYFPTCKRNDPHLEKCLLNLIEELRPRLKEGIPELKVPALDPFFLSSLNINNIPLIIRLNAHAKNIFVFGGSNFKIEQIKLNVGDEYSIQLRIAIPRLYVIADYETRGLRLFFIDLNKKGEFTGIFTGITALVKVTGRIHHKHGVEYTQADKVILKVEIDDGKIEIKSATGSQIARSAMSFFNASPKAVLNSMIPAMEETGSALLKEYINEIFENIPLKEILI